MASVWLVGTAWCLAELGFSTWASSRPTYLPHCRPLSASPRPHPSPARPPLCWYKVWCAWIRTAVVVVVLFMHSQHNSNEKLNIFCSLWPELFCREVLWREIAYLAWRVPCEGHCRCQHFTLRPAKLVQRWRYLAASGDTNSGVRPLLNTELHKKETSSHSLANPDWRELAERAFPWDWGLCGWARRWKPGPGRAAQAHC